MTKPLIKVKLAPRHVKYYLLGYNILSFLGWWFILTLTIAHLSGANISKIAPHTPAPPPQKLTAGSFFGSLLAPFTSKTKFTVPATPISAPHKFQLPKQLEPLFARAEHTYGSGVGILTAWVQSFAILEILHVLLGFVKSPLSTTGIQVASRLFLVWGITWFYPNTRTNPLYTTMVLSWSLTETLRYSYYAFGLLPTQLSHTFPTPEILTYLRYTTFYALYPLGAGSEAGLIYYSVPKNKSFKELNVLEWGRLLLFTVWWPGLYVMYTHMIKQRSKVLGKHKVHHKSHANHHIEPASDSELNDGSVASATDAGDSVIGKRRGRGRKVT